MESYVGSQYGVINQNIRVMICLRLYKLFENKHIPKYHIAFSYLLRGWADKSLARPGRKQATVTKFGIYSTYSPRSSIHFSSRYSNFCKPQKKNSECCPPNQVSAAEMTSASDEKWRPFNCFFQSREQVVV